MVTQSNETNDLLFEDLDPVIQGLGFSTVELRSARRHGTLHVVIVVHRDGGVDVEACAGIYRAIYPRLEVQHNGVDIQLEVSSPGIYRNFKSPREFVIFRDFSVKILLEGENDWQKGTIREARDASVDIEFEGTEKEIEYSVIRKAKLDYP